MGKLSLILATNNIHKKIEFSHVFNECIVCPNDLGILKFECIESGNTFEQNALIKAQTLYRILQTNVNIPKNYVVIADDSGLCVEALDGEPGIFSARYANIQNNILHNENSSDEDNRKSLIDKLKSNNLWGSKAFFQCSIAYIIVADQDEPLQKQGVVNGICNGIVAIKELGNNGFGYDCMFYTDFNANMQELDTIDFTMKDTKHTTKSLELLRHSFATISIEQKNLISHRGKAIKALRDILL